MASSSEAAVDFVRNATGYAFHNSSLLEEALDTAGLRSPDANRRLAMIGEARLKDVILDDWFPTGATRERAAQLVQKTGSNVNLALVARGLGFDHGLGALSEDHKSQDTDGILATLIRAILGSIYWDSRNEQAVRRAMIRMGVFDECTEVDRAG